MIRVGQNTLLAILPTDKPKYYWYREDGVVNITKLHTSGLYYLPGEDDWYDLSWTHPQEWAGPIEEPE